MIVLLPLIVLGLMSSSVVADECDPKVIKDDMQKLVDMVPVDEIMTVAVEATVDSATVRDLFDYILHSNTFKNNIKDFERTSVFKDFVEAAKTQGIDVKPILDKVYEILGIQSRRKRSIPNRFKRGADPAKVAVANRDIRRLVSEILLTLPLKEMTPVFKKLASCSPEIDNLYKAFQAVVEGKPTDGAPKKLVDTVQGIYSAVMTTEPAKRVENDLSNMGLSGKDIAHILSEEISKALAKIK